MMNRRDFLITSGSAALAMGIQKNAFPVLLPVESISDLVVVQNGNPTDLVQRALTELGGMNRFIKSGDRVVVKPNISWDRVPEQGATTNPDIVSEVIKQCFKAGAKSVKVFDFTLNEPRRCYKRSGIEDAAKLAGADVQFVVDSKFKTTDIPGGEILKSWSIYDDLLNADKWINVPAAKHHSVSGVSLGMKNVMGLIGGNRGAIHRQFDIKIVDLCSRIKPNLTILDAYRILKRNGPSGGNLADVELRKTLVAGIDPVSVDSFGASLFGLDPKKIPFLSAARIRGLGQTDWTKMKFKTITLS
jgi:uncharacterized protein (DUF362 family)